MSGSEAEERIRAKAQAALRIAYPTGRIIHELVVKQGGCRIDLATVTPDRLIVVEVKSERDVLTRLERQLAEAREVADGIVVCAAGKHVDEVRKINRGWGWTETATEDDVLSVLNMNERRVMGAMTNAPARLSMLWASELRIVAGTSSRWPRGASMRLAADSLTGAEVRRRVCAALRARPFPRADAPILSELFPEPSKGSFS